MSDDRHGAGHVHSTLGLAAARSDWSYASLCDRIGRPVARGRYVAQIDGLRFLAIASVLVWHISLRASRFVDYANSRGDHLTSLYALFPHGEVGVALFFFVSGFVIAMPFVSRIKDKWSIGDFYMRRFRRIYPPYVIAVTACFLIVTATGFQRSPSSLSPTESWLASLVYLHSAFFEQPSLLDPPIWSLEIEIQFYALAPLIMAIYLLPSQLKTRTISGCLVIAAFIMSASLISAAYPFDSRFRFGLLSHMHLFLAGIVMADVFHDGKPLERPPSLRFDAVFLIGLSLLVLAGIYLTQVDNKPGSAIIAVACHTGILAAVAFIFTGAMRGRVGRSAMGARWIALIGTMCFSIYLVHIIVVEATASLLLRHLPLHDAATIWCTYMLVLVPAALLVGAAFYIAVERPFMTAQPSRAMILFPGWLARAK